MDSTIHYLTYDPKEIWRVMFENYVNAGGDILYPGDEKEILLRSVQADIVQLFAGVDTALRMQTLRYAVGDYLDILGEQRSCTRIEASPATATVIITTSATGATADADGRDHGGKDRQRRKRPAGRKSDAAGREQPGHCERRCGNGRRRRK